MNESALLQGDKERFRSVLVGIIASMAIGFLMLGLSFYVVLSNQIRTNTEKRVVQLLDSHRDNFALELFLHKAKAYQLRTEEIIKNGNALVEDFGLCLYQPKLRNVIHSTFLFCLEDQSDFSEVVFPLDSDGNDDQVMVKARYREDTSILNLVATIPWVFVVALVLLLLMIYYISRLLDRYHLTILEKASQIEKENHTNRAIALTTKMIAHDVRKPLVLLDGTLELLETNKDTQQLSQTIERHAPRIRQAMTKVYGIIDDLMLLGSQDRLNFQITEPSSLVEVSLFEVFARFPNAEIALEYDFKNFSSWYVDPLKIARVIENILTNAVQAMKGRGRIKISTDIGGYMSEMRIWNSNSSIYEDDLDSVFEPFVTSGKRGGTGLGLAICRQIIHQHDGSITARNKDGGVEFSFTVPKASGEVSIPRELPGSSTAFSQTLSLAVEDSEADIATSEAALLESLRNLGRPLSLMIADDEGIYRSRLIQQITSRPAVEDTIEILEASTISATLSLAAVASPDVIILDIDFNEPEKNGFDAVKAIREARSSAVIWLHSSRPEVENDPRDLLFLPKPLSARRLFAELAKAAAHLSGPRRREKFQPLVIEGLKGKEGLPSSGH